MGLLDLLDQMFKVIAGLIIFGVLSFLALIGLAIYVMVN